MNRDTFLGRIGGRGLALAVLMLAMVLPGAVAGRVAPAAAQTPYVPLFRMGNYHTGDHFYTTDEDEAARAVHESGYTYEGITGYISSSHGPGTVPLFRLVNQYNGDHFYTTDSAEALNAGSQFGYRYEGIAGYVWTDPVPNLDLVRLHRLVNHASGHHFYTTSYPEAVNATDFLGFEYEGVAAWIIANPLEFTLSVPKKQYATGGRVHFDIVVRNRGSMPFTLHFASGQTYELVISTAQRGEVWNSSVGRRYAQALVDLTFAPGQERRWSEEWDQRSAEATIAGSRTLVEAGTYHAVARLEFVSQYRPLSNPVGFRLE